MESFINYVSWKVSCYFMLWLMLIFTSKFLVINFTCKKCRSVCHLFCQFYERCSVIFMCTKLPVHVCDECIPFPYIIVKTPFIMIKDLTVYYTYLFVVLWLKWFYLLFFVIRCFICSYGKKCGRKVSYCLIFKWHDMHE